MSIGRSYVVDDVVTFDELINIEYELRKKTYSGLMMYQPRFENNILLLKLFNLCFVKQSMTLLTVKFDRLDYALMCVLVECLKKDRLTGLYFGVEDLGVGVNARVFDMFVNVLPLCSKVELLNVQISAQLPPRSYGRMIRMLELSNVTSLHMTCSKYMTHDEYSDVVASLSTSKLVNLRLWGVSMPRDVFETMCRVMMAMPNLTGFHLVIKDNQFDEFFTEFIKHLPGLPRLTDVMMYDDMRSLEDTTRCVETIKRYNGKRAHALIMLCYAYECRFGTREKRARVKNCSVKRLPLDLLKMLGTMV